MVGVLIAVAGCGKDVVGSVSSPDSQALAVGGSLPPVSGWAGTDLLWDVAASPQGFVAVGNSGVVLQSSDGSEWMQRPAGTAQTLRAVATAADGEKTVAVGAGGIIVTWGESGLGSPVERRSGTDRPLLGIAQGAGRWVAVGGVGTVLWSDDLEVWNSEPATTTGDYFAVDYGAGRFVAVADDGSVSTSTDGEVWTTNRPEGTPWLWDVAFGDGQFVATGSGGTVLRSEDGQTWARADSGTSQALRGVTYANQEFVATGSDGVILASTDAVTWRSLRDSDTGIELWRPAGNGPRWVAVGAGGTRLVSADLDSWSGSASTEPALYGVAADANRVLAVGVGGLIAELDASGSRRAVGPWSAVAQAPGNRELRSVSKHGDLWLAVGAGGTILGSLDGVTFVPLTSGSGAELWASTQISDRLVVVGAGGTVLTSTNAGLAWEAVPDTGTATFFSVSAGPAGVVAVGVDGVMFRSDDGVTWEAVDSPPADGDTLRSIAANSFGYVAVGARGAVLTSTDGRTWTRRRSGTDFTLRAVVATATGWLAVGGGGTILGSGDGVAWSVIPSPTQEELFAMATADSRIVAVAGTEQALQSTDGGRSWKAAG